jgi:DNA-binding transcriptional ArsR family regulator
MNTAAKPGISAEEVSAEEVRVPQKEAMNLDLMQQNASRASDMMKLLSHPHRLMILCELNQGECSVGDLGERIGINQSPLSQHLARMRHEGVVQARREAQTVYYSLAGDEIGAIISLLYSLYCAQEKAG